MAFCCKYMNVEITNFILYKLQAGTTAEKDLQR